MIRAYLPLRWRIGLARLLIRKVDDIVPDLTDAELKELLAEPIEERIAWRMT
ncbi:hypothetical protein [Methylobacterium frigidaeris]|uniref:Uncharacterized protein n=1 Tax=Methylobacterium frigidaeris TaxID=2038277 RepID=A0AA37HFY3_9HYPH|nr:hypothetical protein [Methylobacterium frigidaeris]GJD65133.1 hypothetical protein MPEAHAMD_5320 [Methylobacterium frigidaeris]